MVHFFFLDFSIFSPSEWLDFAASGGYLVLVVSPVLPKRGRVSVIGYFKSPLSSYLGALFSTDSIKVLPLRLRKTPSPITLGFKRASFFGSCVTLAISPDGCVTSVAPQTFARSRTGVFSRPRAPALALVSACFFFSDD